jgi:hypothetical protein
MAFKPAACRRKAAGEELLKIPGLFPQQAAQIDV